MVKNRLGNVDSMRRYIYIHVSPYVEVPGQPNSRSCVTVKNADIIRFYNEVYVGTSILILEDSLTVNT